MYGISAGWVNNATERFEITAVLDKSEGYYVVLDVNKTVFFVLVEHAENVSWEEAQELSTPKVNKKKANVKKTKKKNDAKAASDKKNSANAASAGEAKVAMPSIPKVLVVAKEQVHATHPTHPPLPRDYPVCPDARLNLTQSRPPT